MVTHPSSALTEPILRGRLQDLDMGNLLSALRLGRQYITLEVYDASGDCTGVVSVKAGRIMSASVDGYTGAEAIRRLLRRRDAAEFRVLRQATEADLAAQPLGTFAEISASESLRRTSRSSTSGPSPASNGTYKSTHASEAERPARVMEGGLDQFLLTHVLKVLSTSRQHFELQVQNETATTVGVIEVKSGMLLAASTDRLSGIPAARELVRTQKGRFVAIRRSEKAIEAEALATVAELLQPKAAEPNTPSPLEDAPVEPSLPDNEPIAVMDGKLGDLDVSSILHVAGASRQHTSVQIFDDQRRPLGEIHLKAGQIVQAEAQDVSGTAAVRRLLHCPRDFSFLVQRYPQALELTSSLGGIATVLADAATRQASAPVAQAAHLSAARHAANAANNTWMGGAVLGAGLVLLGGIATAVVLRSPAVETSVSPISMPPEAIAPPPAAVVVTPPAPVLEAKPEVEPPQAPPTTEAPSGIPSKATIASLQAGLRQLGYDTGLIDGVVGPRTVAAIKAFQYAEHLTVDGTLSSATRAVLLRRINEADH